MARFLFTAWPFAGHIYPQIAIALAARAQDHKAAFYTGKAVASTLTSEGLEHFPFSTVDEKGITEALFTPREVNPLLQSPKKMLAIYEKWLLASVPGQIQDLAKILDSWQPDVIVTDPTFWGPVLVLHEVQPIPVAIASFMMGSMIPGPDAPPWGFGLASPNGWLRRTAYRGIEVLTNASLASFREEASRLRSRYGLPPLPACVNSHTANLPLYIVPSLPELDYNRHDLPGSVRYVGACVWNEGHAEETPEWLKQRDDAQPLVHVTEGTMHSQRPFLLKAAAEGLAEKPFEVIMTTGRNRGPDLLGQKGTAGNIRVTPWVSHDVLLPETDVLVTTGGAGTVLTALKHGVPLVVVPTQWDKPDNARRVIEAGAGISLAPRRCTPKKLCQAVEKILAQPLYVQNARRIADRLTSSGGPSKAVELLAALSKD